MKWLRFVLIFHSLSLMATVENQRWIAERTFFQERGYLWIKNFFSQEQIHLLQTWADQVNNDAQTLLAISKATGRSVQELAKNHPQALILVPEAKDSTQVCRAEDMLTCYPVLHDFVAGLVSTYVGALMGEPYVLFKDKINFKWPGGGAFLPHQDFPAYEFFGPREHVTAIISIDPSTLENGCLQVADHWRKTFADDPAVDQAQLQKGCAVLPYIEGGKNHGSIQSQFNEKITWIPLEMSPGDLVLISSFVPHYSEPNHSSSSRRMMLFTHNRLKEGEHRRAYYSAKRHDPDNPVFHFATPTHARTK